MNRLLDGIDEWAEKSGKADAVEVPERSEPTRVDDSPCLSLDLRSGEIRTIVWATGFRPDYSWLEVPVLDRKGRICHDGGVVEAPGLYVMGLLFLRRRKSSFIHGTEDDRAIYRRTSPATWIASTLDRQHPRAVSLRMHGQVPLNSGVEKCGTIRDCWISSISSTPSSRRRWPVRPLPNSLRPSAVQAGLEASAPLARRRRA
jgi:hypothetical protein